MKKVLSPILVLILASGTAFAANQRLNSPKSVVPGYRIGGIGEDPCVVVPKNCETFNTGIICTWTDSNNVNHQLKQLQESECENTLYEINMP